MLSPSRKCHLPSSPCYSFSNYSFENFLEEYHGSTCDIPIKVLILSCGDLPFAVKPTSLCSNQKISNITVTDVSAMTMARNVLFAKIITDIKFDPDSDENLQYLWNVWYNMEWSSGTKERFLRDITELSKGHFSDNLKIPTENDMSILKNTWNFWISSVSEMNLTSMQEIHQQRYESIINHIHGLVSNKTSKQENNVYKPTLAEVWEWMIAQTKAHIDQNTSRNAEEMRIYFETGNCFPDKEQMICVNPTLLEPETGHWALISSVSPFEIYFNLKQLPAQGDFLESCKKGLCNQVKSYQKWIQDASLTFHIGDPLELCYLRTWTEPFNIVDCSKLPCQIGLANILNAGRLVLADDPHAVLLTESSPWRENTGDIRYDSSKEFVEESLCTSIQMIPSLFGLVLINHVLLGNTLPLKTSWRSSVRLYWKNCPNFTNMRIENTGAISDFFESLQTKIFSELEVPKSNIFESSFTPLTYCYLVSSFTARVDLLETIRESLEQPCTSLHPSSQLAWKLAWNTLHLWMNGGKILQLKIILKPTSKEDKGLRLILANQNDKHFIDNFGVRRDGCDIIVSFMLLEDHRLDLENTIAYLISGDAHVSSSCSLADVSTTILDVSAPFTRKADSIAFLTCQEFEGFYHVDLPGIKQEDMILSTDRQPPAEAAHQVTLLAGEICQELTFPWPFKVADVHSSCETETNHVRLILPKSINEPHPYEWKDRKKWDISSLSLWNTKSLLKDLNYHLCCQFQCRDLKHQMLNETEDETTRTSSYLKGVREIIRTLFQSTTLDGNILYVIRSKDDPKLKNLWFIRVHLPVLISPSGAPMLLLTANDHRLAQKLVDRGELEQTKATEDFKRIFVEGVSSSEVCPLFVNSEEEEGVLRYLLRLNSTKILTNAWPIEQLPVGENSPWLATFVSPCYADQTGTEAEMEDLVATTTRISIQSQEEKNAILKEQALEPSVCSKCKQIKENLKRCSRCRSVKYCSVDCQRSDWTSHKSSCL